VDEQLCGDIVSIFSAFLENENLKSVAIKLFLPEGNTAPPMYGIFGMLCDSKDKLHQQEVVPRSAALSGHVLQILLVHCVVLLFISRITPPLMMHDCQVLGAFLNGLLAAERVRDSSAPIRKVISNFAEHEAAKFRGSRLEAVLSDANRQRSR
jgi:hypothetical protein